MRPVRPLIFALLALLFVLATCSATSALILPSASAVAPTNVPAPLPTPSVLPTATAVKVAVPLVGTARPTPTTVPPSPSPAPPAFDVAAQRAALLPAFHADLADAAAWDRYTLNLRMDPQALSVSGTLLVEFTNRATVALDTIYFRLYPNHPDFGGGLRVDAARVGGQNAPFAAEVAETALRVGLAQPLAPGASVRIELDFLARTPRNASDETFGAFNMEAGVWSIASFYPMLARYSADGQWDRRAITSRGDFTVSSVALYDVTIDAPAAWNLVTSGVRIDQQPLDGGARRERYVSGPQREFYLGAVQGLDQASTTVDGTRIVTYYQPGNKAGGAASLRAGEDALRAYNARYGTYPLAELEIIQAALTNFLGMEYPGAVLIEQRLYATNSRGLLTTVVHEIGHQWWYSLVGNDAQRDPWLDEGLASYSQIVYFEALGDRVAAEGELDAFRDTYRRARANGRDAPLNTPPDQLPGNYVAIVYAKSALFSRPCALASAMRLLCHTTALLQGASLPRGQRYWLAERCPNQLPLRSAAVL
ncbi:M1 family metallopeptidase [Candidatus Gracilibacteria bacterium]|nr:M1 family metallopeptidase [Candidatus Gracilibacteria bacterium]